ncbi:MAG TPA: hypothetical protein VKX25_09910 [Bryobacteraceae bacterium]|nr:hypothetical protein [Bryobacteraceae bacterium]
MRSIILTVLLAAILVSTAAASSIITEAFTGTVSPDNHYGGPTGSVYNPPVGSNVHGTISIDLSTMQPQPGGFDYVGNVYITVSDVNGTQTSVLPVGAQIMFLRQKTPAEDQFLLFAENLIGTNFVDTTLLVNFAPGTFKTASPADLPLAFRSQTSPPGSYGSLVNLPEGAEASYFGFTFDLSTLSPANGPSTAPEPATAGLFALFGSGLLLLRRGPNLS